MRSLALTFALLICATLSVAQDSVDNEQKESGIAPPADLNIQPAPEVLPAPGGEREGGLEFDEELDLGKLLDELGPDGHRILENNADRGISFGLDMAERGISFGLRYANGQAGPADAKAFGLDMGRRGKALGFEMRDKWTNGRVRPNRGQPPVDGRGAKFQETPSDITIDAPPLPLGTNTTRPLPEARVYGREMLDREVKFRREF